MLERVKQIKTRSVELTRWVINSIREAPGVWFNNEVEGALLNKKISEEKAERLIRQAKDPATARYIADIFHCTVTARLASYPISAVVGGIGYSYDNPWMVAYAVATHAPIIPKISITGMERFLYLGLRIGYDHLTIKDKAKLPDLTTEVFALVAAPFTPIGNLSAPARASKTAGEVTLFATQALGNKAENFFTYPKVGQDYWITRS